MPGVTKEQVARAREVDALDYLRVHDPGAVRRSAPNEFCLVEHDSLKLSNGKWCWFSRGVGGRSALDFLIAVRGYEFVDAVETLTGERAAPARSMPLHTPAQTQERKPLVLPPATKIPYHAVAYLQQRGIDAEIISACMERGLLYESSYGGSPVCVFIGVDTENKPRYVALRGTDADFKQDCPGSDKRYGFCLSSGNMTVLLVKPGEAPVAVEMENGLKPMQEAVGGYIEVVYPYDDLVGIVCNEKGKLTGMELNRAIKDEEGNTTDIIAGPFLVCGLSEDNFGSLSPELIDKYQKLFEHPEKFVQLGRQIIAVPYKTKEQEAEGKVKQPDAQEL